MGKKGGKRHLKRKPAPRFWPIHRKEAVWTVKPNPGPHSIAGCFPLTLVVRDVLGFARIRKEVRKIISDGKVIVDGKVQREEAFPTGLMDVVSIKDVDKCYRLLPYEKGLTLHQISKDEAGFKLCRIENKTVLRGGYVQLNLHDGRNILIKVKDPNKPEEDVYQTLSTLKIGLHNQEILGHFKLTEGVAALIVRGKNSGKNGKIVSIEREEKRKRKSSLMTIEDEKGNQFQTTMDYVFVVGDAKPIISLQEAN
jgi:small subunit ribosomal protein S4e